MKNVCGIDPGISAGAISLIQNDFIRSWVLPKAKEGGLNLDELCEIISEIETNYKPIWLIEDIHSIFGSSAKSMFNMAKGVGHLEGILNCSVENWRRIQPKEWQKKVWILSDIVFKDPNAKRLVKDTKATSLNAVERLFPNEELIYGVNEVRGRRTKKHEGIIDSLLIAYSYGK